MTKEDFNSLLAFTVKPSPFVIPATLFTKDLSDRTLLYGYDIDRVDHHVYLINGFVQRYDRANLPNIYMKLDKFETYDELVPNKRLLPHLCDYDFCLFLKSKGVYLPFTTYSDMEIIKKKFYAEIWSS